MSDLVNQSIDPFAFFPGAASRIGGLGGHAAAQDPGYVLHTVYVPVAPGKRHFTIRFDGLVATSGSLLLRVHMLPPEVGAHAKLMNSQRIPLEQLAALGGEVTIGFDGYPRMAYAVYAMVADLTDARATGVQVFLDLGARPETDVEIVAGSAATAGVRQSVRPTAQILTLEAPTFERPVSQAYTSAQMKEAAARPWKQKIDGLDLDQQSLWSRAIVGQVAERYGLVMPGSRFLATGDGIDVLPAIFATSEVSTTIATGRPEEEPAPYDRERYAAICPADILATHVRQTRFDYAFALPPGTEHFDFLWSDGVLNAHAWPDGLSFITAMLSALRPGGLAAHVTRVSSRADAGVGSVYAMRDLERWSLTLIAHGHEMAQLKLPRWPLDKRGISRGDVEPVSFVFIVRRAPS